MSGDFIPVVFSSCRVMSDGEGYRAVAVDRKGRRWVHTWSLDRERALKIARAVAIAGDVDPKHWDMEGATHDER